MVVVVARMGARKPPSLKVVAALPVAFRLSDYS